MSSSAEEDSWPQPNKGHKILQEYKDELVSHVTAIELIDFSAKLRRSLVISQKVHDVFAMLDDTLEPMLRLRYLVQCVCGGVKQDITVFDRFLKVLAGYGGTMKQLASHLCEKLYGSDRGAGTESLALANEAGGSKTLGGDIYLVEENVPGLMEILVEVCDTWELLGIALALPHHILDDCKGSAANAVNMTKILCEWISRNKQESNTLKRLQLALASQLVGRCGIAETLENRFREFQKPSAMILVAKTPELEPHLSVVCQSCSTVVTDGRSTLLEVQVSVSEGASYQWMKDGQSISDGQAYSGSQTDILLISPASQATQGKYACHITKDSEIINGDVIHLTVSFPPEKKHLIKQYTKNQEIPRDSWPPKVTTTFINLALITKKNEVTDDYKCTVRGDIDDILESKEKIDFDEVFGEYESGALVLVEGRPGSGKTTLLHKVSRDWATGGDVLKNAILVFLFPLRRLANRKTENLSDILELLFQNPQKCEKVARDVNECNGAGVCFILDGLDEFHPQDEIKSVIHQLLYEKYLPEAMVVVSSRPVATEKTRCETHVTRRIEVLGFSHPQILEYIDNYPFTSYATNSASAPSQLKLYLNSHHNILHMCYLPVHVAMICFLYEHERGDIPPIETEIYGHFTKFIILRNLKRNNERADLSSLEDLQGNVKENFSKICQLAFHMTINSTQTVCQRDTKVQLYLDNGSDDTATLGLVTIDRTAELHKLDNTYTFLHLTFQEYLSAFYLAKLNIRKQMKMIKLYAGVKHMRVVWKFYCGITKFKKNAHIQHIIRFSGMEPKDASLYATQCAFESQQHVVCDSIVKENTGVLSYYNSTLTLADMTAVGFVISTTSLPITELAMSGCLLGDDHVKTLLGKVSHNKLNTLLIMRFHGNNIRAEGACALGSGLKSCNNLELLWLHNNNIGGEGASSLAGGLKTCNNLQTLDLSNNNIGAEGASSIASGLKVCNNLHTLSLSTNNIGDEGASALAATLKTCNHLIILELHSNNIGDEGASSLSGALMSCNNLQILSLSNNNIGNAGATSLSGALMFCNNLQSLWLHNNNIGDEGSTSLAGVLKPYNNLQSLNLSANNIGDEGASSLAVGLESCKNLQSLYLFKNNIGDDGASNLAGALMYCKELHTLSLSNNNIGDEGALSLAGQFKSCNNLKLLHIYNNNIGDKCLSALKTIHWETKRWIKLTQF